MTYGYLKDHISRSPLTDKSYFCEKCGIYNSPFSYFGREFDEIKKKNLCRKCRELEKKKDLYEKTTQ